MSYREQCKLILIKMKQLGDDVTSPCEVDNWTDEECDYFSANYESLLIN